MGKGSKKKKTSSAKKKTGKRGSAKKPILQPKPEIDPVEEIEAQDSSEYVSPVFLNDPEDKSIGVIDALLAAVRKALAEDGAAAKVAAEFSKIEKGEFGFSTKGKVDFCEHQLALYVHRMSALLAGDSPEAKRDKKLKRLKAAQAKREEEIKALEAESK